MMKILKVFGAGRDDLARRLAAAQTVNRLEPTPKEIAAAEVLGDAKAAALLACCSGRRAVHEWPLDMNFPGT